MKRLLLCFLTIIPCFGVYAQFGLDTGLKLSSYAQNRFQLEQRFHFDDKISVLISFGYNRSRTRNNETYDYSDYNTSVLIVNRRITNFYQVKLGLSRDLVRTPTGAGIYVGISGGYNFRSVKDYQAFAQLTFEYDEEQDEYNLIYEAPRSTRKMELIDSRYYEHFSFDGFVGAEYVMENNLILFLSGNLYADFFFKKNGYFFSPGMYPFEINGGIRYVIKER